MNIFWNLLPCLLQNGADITDYIIRYNRTSSGEFRNVSTSDNQLMCGEVSGGHYRCLLPFNLFVPGPLYSFQVSALNRYGAGPFSDPIITDINVQSISLTMHDKFR